MGWKTGVGSADKGYQGLNDDLRHDYGIHVNGKHVLRICCVRDTMAGALPASET